MVVDKRTPSDGIGVPAQEVHEGSQRFARVDDSELP